MGVHTDIQAALDAKLDTLSPKPAIAWHNVAYTPTENTSWIRPTLLSAKSNLFDMANTRHHQGTYQIDIFVPLEKGVSALLTIVDNVITLFNNTSLTKNSTVVRISNTSRGLTERDNAWYRGTVLIDYHVYL